MNKFSQNTTYFNLILLRKLELYRLRFFSIKGNFVFRLFILTSSQATVTYGNNNTNKIYNGSDWTNFNNPSLDQYIRSRTISEKMAWEFINSQENKTLELCTIHPGFIVGPLLHDEIRGISAKKFKSIFLTTID